VFCPKQISLLIRKTILELMALDRFEMCVDVLASERFDLLILKKCNSLNSLSSCEYGSIVFDEGKEIYKNEKIL
jgi:hypothetical protein